MRFRNSIVAGALIALLASSSALAGGHEAKIQNYIDKNIRGWLGSAEIINAVDQQNLDNLGLTDAKISVLDTRWRKEKLRGGGSLISSKMDNDLSTFLRGIKAASGGVITEIFIMDNHGLNVGQTNGTGDYNQGDEGKWQKTFLVGKDAVFIDEVEEDGGLNVAQTNLSVARDNGFLLGAVTVGINVDALK